VLSISFCFNAEANNGAAKEDLTNDATLNKEQILSTKIELSNEIDFSSVVAITYSANKASPYKPDNITLLLSSENAFKG